MSAARSTPSRPSSASRRSNATCSCSARRWSSIPRWRRSARSCTAIPRSGMPTFSLALGAFPDAHWSALTPGGPVAPLAAHRCLPAGGAHHCAAAHRRARAAFPGRLDALDERLAAIVEPCQPAHAARFAPGAGACASPRSGRAARAGDAARHRAAVRRATLPRGARSPRRRCAEDRPGIVRLPAPRCRPSPAELDVLARLWEREAWLGGRALCVDCDALDAARRAACRACASSSSASAAAADRSARAAARRRRARRCASTCGRRMRRERRELWRDALGESRRALERRSSTHLAAQFALSAPSASRAVAAALRPGRRRRAARSGTPAAARRAAGSTIWRSASRPRDAGTTWCCRSRSCAVLREIAAQVRQRTRVYDDWGFAAK